MSNWNREGQQITGTYLDTHTVTGMVLDSRVKYGGKVQHTVLLDRPIEVFGRIAEHLLLEEEDVTTTHNKA